MAISVIPDLDLNGFSDVVVGAPMEDKEKGVIYIYNGYNKGLKKDFSQVQHTTFVFKKYKSFLKHIQQNE